jgi:dimethylamine monooxygenase subunit A
MSSAILHQHLPLRPWAEEKTRRLPGLNPVAPGDWLRVDEVFAEQMALRDALIANRPGAVLALAEAARPAAEELLDAVLAEVSAKPGYVVGPEAVRRPDGVDVPLDRGDPLATAGRLVQEDLVILEQPEGEAEHLLTGAVLCFPASWTLEQKFRRPLTTIHTPVPEYDDNIARRVQRLFDGLQPDRPVWRANYLVYGDPALHQPRREGEGRALAPGGARWLRMERQVLKRLERTRAVVFTIHTFVLAMDALEPQDRAALAGCAEVG